MQLIIMNGFNLVKRNYSVDSTDSLFLQTMNPGWKERLLMKTENIKKQEQQKQQLSDEEKEKLNYMLNLMYELYLEYKKKGLLNTLS